MKSIKTKYENLSEKDKVTYLSISIILAMFFISIMYNSGKVFGQFLYHIFQ